LSVPDELLCTELSALAAHVSSDVLNVSVDVTSPAEQDVSSGDDDDDAVWKARMREVQGGLLVASVAQMVIGATGLASVLMRYIGPLTVSPVITLVAVPLFNVAAGYCAKNWWIAFLCVHTLATLSLPLSSFFVDKVFVAVSLGDRITSCDAVCHHMGDTPAGRQTD